MRFRIESSAVQSLIQILRRRGYTTIGPTLRGGAIVYDEISSVDDLPKGWTEEQEPGSYRLGRRDDESLFGYTVGPYSWKKFLFPPERTLFTVKRKAQAMSVVETEPDDRGEHLKPMAFLGVRSCELHAIQIQDKVFASDDLRDPYYTSLREQVFIVAVNCSASSANCFCASMGTGPKVAGGYDLALTEIVDEGSVYYTVDVGSDKGEKILKGIEHRPVRDEEDAKSDTIVRRTASEMKKKLDTVGIKELLYSNQEHPRWEGVGNRCLSCANCTLVCPTCFCSTVEDSTDLEGGAASRTRKWDSCFTLGFSYIHGGSVRTSATARYRQWMTHKLAAWIDQFGLSGCVGCGRCITWCPVGIDITEEAKAIHENRS